MTCPECGHTAKEHMRGSRFCLSIQLVRIKTTIKLYLDAHDALVQAGMGPDRPQVAMKLGDAWLALKGAAK